MVFKCIICVSDSHDVCVSKVRHEGLAKRAPILGRANVVQNIVQRVAVTHARIGGWFVLNHLVRVGVDEKRFVEYAKATPVTQPNVTARTKHDTRLAFRTHATRERRFQCELVDHQLFAPFGEAERFAQHALIRPVDVVVRDPRF